MLNRVVFSIDVFSECEYRAMILFIKIHSGYGQNRTDTEWLLRPPPLPLGYVTITNLIYSRVAIVGLEPTLC